MRKAWEKKNKETHTHTQKRIKDDTQWFAVCVYPNQVIARVARRDASRSLSLLLLVISSLLFFYYPPFSVAGNGTRWFIFTNERDQWPPPICCRNESANEGRWTAGSWKKSLMCPHFRHRSSKKHSQLFCQVGPLQVHVLHAIQQQLFKCLFIIFKNLINVNCWSQWENHVHIVCLDELVFQKVVDPGRNDI